MNIFNKRKTCVFIILSAYLLIGCTDLEKINQLSGNFKTLNNQFSELNDEINEVHTDLKNMKKNAEKTNKKCENDKK